jgi:hypothetical protein
VTREVKCQPLFPRYASLQKNFNDIDTNQNMGPQGVRKPDSRVHRVYHLRAEPAVPPLGSVCAVVDELPYSDVSQRLQIS